MNKAWSLKTAAAASRVARRAGAQKERVDGMGAYPTEYLPKQLQ
ncbi:hypothetical protein [Christensenella tenuis]|jgi:hypothetical protein|nr:hypothetical protein [Christensenella tenuis]